MSEMWSVISIERVQLEYIVTENAKCIEFVVDLKPLFFTRSLVVSSHPGPLYVCICMSPGSNPKILVKTSHLNLIL